MDNLTGNKIIPIVFVCSNDFISVLGVAIQSIIENASTEYSYHIYVLYSSRNYFNLDKAYKLYTVLKENIELHFIDVRKAMKDAVFYGYAHVSEETCYRLIIPQVVKGYSKVIYLDCDLVVVNDLVGLFETDISKYAFAAVKEELNIYQKEYVQKHLGVSDAQYVNTGVMLINMEKFTQLKLYQQYITAIVEKRRYRYPEQDLLNIICKDQILFLNVKWNIRWYLPKDQTYEVAVMHYASRVKPWNCREIYMEEYFWYYASKSLFYNELLSKREQV